MNNYITIIAIIIPFCIYQVYNRSISRFIEIVLTVTSIHYSSIFNKIINCLLEIILYKWNIYYLFINDKSISRPFLLIAFRSWIHLNRWCPNFLFNEPFVNRSIKYSLEKMTIQYINQNRLNGVDLKFLNIEIIEKTFI